MLSNLALLCRRNHCIAHRSEREPTSAGTSARCDDVGVIASDQVVPLLLEACPSFADKWSTIQTDRFHLDFDGSRLHFIDAGVFARHLVELQTADTVEEFPAVFGVIERLHMEGDEYVQNLAVVGYLEDIQNFAFDYFDPATFVPYLGPASLKSWNELNVFWGSTDKWPPRSGLYRLGRFAAGLVLIAIVVAWCAS